MRGHDGSNTVMINYVDWTLNAPFNIASPTSFLSNFSLSSELTFEATRLLWLWLWFLFTITYYQP
jgi:hypothetical protein